MQEIDNSPLVLLQSQPFFIKALTLVMRFFVIFGLILIIYCYCPQTFSRYMPKEQ